MQTIHDYILHEMGKPAILTGCSLVKRQANPPPLPECGLTPGTLDIVLDQPFGPLLATQSIEAQGESLPSLQWQSILVDLYFSYCHNQPYSLFHENTFRHRFNTGALPPPLLLAVVANSSRFANHLPTDKSSPDVAAEFAAAAWNAISATCFAGTETVDITILQTLVLLCIFDFTGLLPCPMYSIKPVLRLTVVNSRKISSQCCLGEDRNCCTACPGPQRHRRTERAAVRGRKGRAASNLLVLVSP